MAAHLFSIANFRRLWFTGLVICVVRWLEMLALALYAYQITGSAFVVAMLPMLRLLPMALFGAFIGAAAERFEQRRSLILIVVVSMITTLVLAILASVGAIAVWHLAAASFIGGLNWAADHPVRRMMVGDAVGAERVASALSLDTATNHGSRIVGPALGGLLLAQYGIASVFWFNFALYVLAIIAVLRIGKGSRSGIAHATSMLTSIREGFTWVRRERRLLGVFAVTIIFNVFGWPYTSMIPVIGTDYLQLTPKGVGLLAACEGVGGLSGALLLAWLARPAWYGRIYATAVMLYLSMVIAFALAPTPTLAGTALYFAGMGNAGFAVMQATLVYRSAPPEMRARLLGVITVCIGTGPIGFLYLGFLADLLTPRVATVALGAQGIIAMLLTRRYWAAATRL